MNAPENNKNIQDFEIVNDLLLVNFSDGSEAIVSLKRLRDECPCAAVQVKRTPLEMYTDLRPRKKQTPVIKLGKSWR